MHLVGAQDPRKVELCSQRGDLEAVQPYSADRRRWSGCSIRSRRVGDETLRSPDCTVTSVVAAQRLDEPNGDAVGGVDVARTALGPSGCPSP